MTIQGTDAGNPLSRGRAISGRRSPGEPVMRLRAAFVMVAMLFCAAPSVVHGYLSSYPSYDSMAARSDLVVIATPLARQEQVAEAQLPGVSQGPNREPVPAVEIETTFTVLAVLRGDEKLTSSTLALVHYREKTRDPSGVHLAGPMLIDFKAGDGSAYLMFLKYRSDGRVEAFSAVEPGWCIVKLPHGSRP
jgi:hypothetical protein